MSQLCLIPTRESNILDLIITNQAEQISILDICNPTELGMKTDHKVTRFTFSKSSNNILSNKRLVYDYKSGNFDDLRKRLIDMDIRSLMTNNGTDSSIDDDWSIWKNGVLTAVHEFIPTKHVNPKRSPPWITPTILHQIREKVITRKRYLSRGTDYLKEKFSRLRAQVKKAIKESRESFFQSLGSTLKINPKVFGPSSKLSHALEVYSTQSREFVRTILKVDHRHPHRIILHQCLTSTFIRYTPASWKHHPQLNLVHFLQYQVFHQLISPKKKCGMLYRT